MLGWMSSLADATRARILRLVERHELTVADLCAVLQLPQSTVSRHLKVLADDAWLTARPDGTSRLYRMASDGLEPTARRLWALVRELFDLKPASIIQLLGLKQPIYRRTASYGHFGRPSDGPYFSWERIDRVADLRSAAGLGRSR